MNTIMILKIGMFHLFPFEMYNRRKKYRNCKKEKESEKDSKKKKEKSKKGSTTVRPRSSYPFYIVSYYWTYSTGGK